jgi:AraC-like DNA-binding protein
MVHPVSGHSNKSQLEPPSLDEIAKLAQLSRKPHSKVKPMLEHVTPPRNLRRRLTPQAIEELVARYTAGEQTPALSRAFGISESSVRRLLRDEGVTLRGHKITATDVQKAVRLYERGLTINQVAREVGYSWGTIRRVLLESGISTTQRFARLIDRPCWNTRSANSSSLLP